MNLLLIPFRVLVFNPVLHGSEGHVVKRHSYAQPLLAGFASEDVKI
jgi:hypothetical protein